MKIEFNTLYWPNTDPRLINSQKSVTKHFNIPVNYYEQAVPHGAWMDYVCKESKSDVIGFFDADCVPLDYTKILECIKYVSKHDTFLGCAQASNHISPKTHIFAAPCFFLVTKSCWEKINTSFSETYRSDVAEEFCYAAESIGQRYRAVYPSYFEREPVEGVWPLHNYGHYGIGTTFENTVYHLYQGRYSKNVDLFEQRCIDIINGTFTTEGAFNTKNYNYEGRKVA